MFDASSQSVSEVASEPQKVALGGARAVPGGAREVPESSPSPLERPRDASGAPPEVARSAQRMQQGTGDLKTSPWDLKKLTPEAPGTSFWSFRVRFSELLGLLLGHPRTRVSKAAPQRKLPGGGGESPQALSIYIYIYIYVYI